MNGLIEHKRRIPSIFSATLYWVGIKRLRVMALIAAITLGLPSLSTLFSCFMMYSLTLEDNPISVLYILGAYSGMIIIAVQLPIYPIVAIDCVFSFLNKRKSSDFYHALPYSRFSLFNSFFLAAASWVLLIMIPAALAFCVSSSAVSLNDPFTEILRSSLPIFVGTFFLMALFALAKALTGTRFANIIFALTLTFSISLSIFELVDHFLYITPTNTLDLLQTISSLTEYPIIYSFQGIPDITQSNLSIDSIAPLLCTIILYILALTAFCFRKSETAERPTSYSLTTYLLGALFVFPIILSAIIRLLGDPGAISYTLCALPIIVYFVIQIIINKSLIKALRSIPVFIIAVAVAAGSLFGVTAASRQYETNLPNASELEAVTFDNTILIGDYYTRYDFVCEFKSYDEIEFFTELLQESANLPNAENSIFRPVTFVYKDGTSITRRVATSLKNDYLNNELLPSQTCSTLLKTALDSDLRDTYYKDKDYSVTDCYATVHYLDNGHKLAFQADDRLLQVINDEFSTMSAVERSLITNDEYPDKNGTNGLRKNKYCVTLYFELKTNDSKDYRLHYLLAVDKSIYPEIYNAIEKHFTAEVPIQ